MTKLLDLAVFDFVVGLKPQTLNPTPILGIPRFGGGGAFTKRLQDQP